MDNKLLEELELLHSHIPLEAIDTMLELNLLDHPNEMIDLPIVFLLTIESIPMQLLV